MSGATDLPGLLVEEVGRALPPGRALPDVLELGCGAGALAERLRAALPGTALLATDASVRMVALTAERGVPSRVLDLAATDLPAASYDVVVASRLDDLGEPDAVLGEIARVLRPGGALVAVTAHAAPARRHFGEVRGTDVAGRTLLVAR